MRSILVAIACGAGLLIGCGSDGGNLGLTAAAGTGGAGVASASASSSASVGGGGSDGGAGGAPPCADPTVFFDIDGDGPTRHLGEACQPRGYLSHGGGVSLPDAGPPPPASDTLYLAACPTLTSDTRIWIYAGAAMWPTTSSQATVHYQKGGVNLDETPPTSGTLQITNLGQVGGVIEGTFSAAVAPKVGDGGAPLALSGAFRVCRAPDIESP